MESERVLSPGTLVAGRYRVLELIGVGGMGIVYRCRDRELGLEVALKVLRPEGAEDPELQKRFGRELILGRQVSHRNVVRIHDIGRDGDMTFLTMDLVAGRSLKDVLKQEGPLDLQRAVDVTAQLAAALGAAHREGVIHRDLKPANVLLDGAGRAYVTDFGIARSLGETGLTRTGSVVGTPDYLSPEQARGEAVDHRTDIYSLGLLLFEMLSGELPFRPGTYAELLAQRTSGRPRELSEVGVEAPGFIRAVLRRCLARDPAERYGSAEELAADLEAARLPRRRLLWRRWRRPAAAVLAAAAFVLLLAAGARWLGSRQTAGAAPPRHAVAVLPLADETGRAELAWMSPGIAEMVAADLADSPRLRVVDSMRVFRTADDLELPRGPLPPAEGRLLAELLDADRLVTGRVRTAGGRIRVDLEVVAALEPGRPVQRVHVEVDGADATSHLVEQLARSLRRHLGVPPRQVRGPPLPASADALGAYSEGTALQLRGAGVEAVASLQRAVETAPRFAAAWVRLAAVHRELGHGEAALEAARRAVDLLPADSGRLGYEARALEASLAGDPGTAQEILREVASRYPRAVEPRVALAEAYGDEGRLAEAAGLLEEVVEEDPQHPRAWYLLGKYAIMGGDSRRAVDDYLVRALVIQNRLGNRREKATVLNALGAAFQQLEDFDHAAEYYRQAAELHTEAGDRQGASMALGNLAAVHARRGVYDEATATLRQALELRRQIGDRVGIATLENRLGTVEERRGRYREALASYRAALALRRELGDLRAVGQTLSNVGFAEFLTGAYEDAAGHWREARAIQKESGNRIESLLTTQNMGQLAMVRGDWEEALRAFLDTLESSRELGLQSGEAVSLVHLGRVAHHQGRFGAALSSYGEAREVLSDIGDPRGLAELALFEAETLLAVGLPGEAAESLEHARGWLEQGGNLEQRAELLRLEAARSLAEGRPEEAHRASERAIEEAAASGARAVMLAARLSLGRAELAAGDTGAARSTLSRVLQGAAGLGHLPLRLDAAAELARAELVAGRLAEAEAVARRGLEGARDHEPTAAAYRLQLLLAEALEGRGADPEADRARAAAAREAARLRADLQGPLLDAFERTPEIRELVTPAESTATTGEA